MSRTSRSNRFKSKADAIGKAIKVHDCQTCGRLQQGGKKPKMCECGSTDILSLDSIGEHRRFCELKMLLRAKQIKDLRTQVPFPMYPARDAISLHKIGKPVFTYYPDFVYKERDGDTWVEVIEDFKGSAEHATDLFYLKKRIIESAYQIQIRITT